MNKKKKIGIILKLIKYLLYHRFVKKDTINFLLILNNR